MKRILLVLISLTFATSAFSQNFNYNYVQGGLVYIDDRTGTDYAWGPVFLSTVAAISRMYRWRVRWLVSLLMVAGTFGLMAAAGSRAGS